MAAPEDEQKERTKVALFARFEPAEGAAPGPFKTHDVTTFELLQNRVKGCRSLVEKFQLTAPGGATLVCEPPCVGVFRCNTLIPFVIMAADVGSNKTRLEMKVVQIEGADGTAECGSLCTLSFEKGALASELVKVHPLPWLAEKFVNWDRDVGWLDSAYAKHKVTDPRPLQHALKGLSAEERKAQLTNPVGTPAPTPSNDSKAIQELLQQGQQNQNAILSMAGQLCQTNADRFQCDSSGSGTDTESSEGEQPVEPKKLFTPAAADSKRTRTQVKKFVAEPSTASGDRGTKKRSGKNEPPTKQKRGKMPKLEAKSNAQESQGTKKLLADLEASKRREREKDAHANFLRAKLDALTKMQSQSAAFQLENNALKGCIRNMKCIAMMGARDRDLTKEQLDDALVGIDIDLKL